MALYLLVLCLFISVASVSAQNLCARQYGGVCNSLPCTSYYVPPSENTPLCYNGQRCCVADTCTKQFNGVCMHYFYTCPGASYTHFGTSQICQRMNDACCITSTGGSVTSSPVVTAAPTIPSAQSEPCTTLGGRCQNQNTVSCSGTYELFMNGKILCNNILTDRCCLKSGSSGSSTTRPVTTNTNAKCGIATVNHKQKRIVGGQTAQKGAWPWQVSIVKSDYFWETSFTHTCGGSMISSQWVLTAAHCFQGVSSITSLRIRVGEHSFRVNEGSEENIQVANLYIHKYYDSTSSTNDIALIKLKQPIDVSKDYVGLACLPTTADLNAFYQTKECYSTGWGLTQGGGDSQVLNEVQNTLVSQSACYRNWGSQIDSTKVCFGDGFKQPCRGDSGGPLVCRKSIADPFYLVGVVSYGSESCTEAYVPTVFTSVAAYRNWITQTMNSNP